jgi:alkylhydroperoxidase family enzyme
VPNLYRVMAHVPQFVDGWIDMAWLIRREATFDRGIREVAIMRKAYLHGVDYLWRHHWAMAVKAGVAPGRLMALPGWRDSPEFTPAEREVLEMVDQLSSESFLVPGLWRELREHFTDQEAVELIVTTAWYSCVSQTLASLEVAVEDRFTDLPPVPANATPGSDGH